MSEVASPRARSVGNVSLHVALDVLIAIGVMVAVMVAGMAAWGVYHGFMMAATGASHDALNKAITQPPILLMMLLSAIGTSAAAAAVYFFRRRASREERETSFAAARQPMTWAWGVGTGIAVFLLVTGISALLDHLGWMGEPSNLGPLQQLQESSPWFLVLFAVVIAPVSEEFLFRRGFFGRYRAAGYATVGVVVSSVLFGLSHELGGGGQNSLAGTLVLIALYSLMGAGFAWIYQRRGTLLAPILAHATNNAIACTMLLLGLGNG